MCAYVCTQGASLDLPKPTGLRRYSCCTCHPLCCISPKALPPLPPPLYAQVVNKASLPLLLALTGVPFAVLATPAGLYAKRSTQTRNTVLLLGIAALIAADLCYAFVLTVPGVRNALSVCLHVRSCCPVQLFSHCARETMRLCSSRLYIMAPGPC